MATSKPAFPEKALSKAPRIIGENEKGAFDQAIQRRIAERAYLLYEASGRGHGNHDAHWLQAEHELLQRGLEIRESGSWLSVNASIPDVTADNIQIYLDPRRLMVRAEKSQAMLDGDSKEHEFAPQELFLIGDLNVEVEPDTASAAFKDQKLTVMVKKRYPVTAVATAPIPAQTDLIPSPATTAKVSPTKG
jgi:HSP20 family molecular chaperone IbpA